MSVKSPFARRFVASPHSVITCVRAALCIGHHSILSSFHFPPGDLSAVPAPTSHFQLCQSVLSQATPFLLVNVALRALSLSRTFCCPEFVDDPRTCASKQYTTTCWAKPKLGAGDCRTYFVWTPVYLAILTTNASGLDLVILSSHH